MIVHEVTWISSCLTLDFASRWNWPYHLIAYRCEWNVTRLSPLFACNSHYLECRDQKRQRPSRAEEHDTDSVNVCDRRSDGCRVLSAGSYHDIVHLFDRDCKTDVNLRVAASLDVPSSNGGQQAAPLKPFNVLTSSSLRRKKDEVSVDKLNYTHKLLHTAWHPTDCIMAVTSGNRIYALQGKYVWLQWRNCWFSA